MRNTQIIPLSLALACTTLCSASPSHAFKLLGAAWNPDRGPITYSIEPSGSDDIADDSEAEALRTSFRRWSCNIKTSIRFIESPTPGVKALDLNDNINTLFWDETGEFGLGPATLGITLGNAPAEEGQTVVREAADIVFNGFDSTWSADDGPTAVDVQSIAMHEIGHWMGLDHPCTDDTEADCLGADDAVMTPVYPGGLVRDPRTDDINGIQQMYPSTDESTCDGPFRAGEECVCNESCVAGLLCSPNADGSKQVCSPTCDSGNSVCAPGFACILGIPDESGTTSGTCLQLATDARKPPASICENDAQCERGLCIAVASVGRSICRVSCAADEECPAGYACTDGVCLNAVAAGGLDCPPEGCTCQNLDAPAMAAQESTAPWRALLLSLPLIGLAMSMRWRRARR